MNRATQATLVAHTRRFYSEHAEDFSATREQPWPGWQRALRGALPSARLRVLDVGCGNARLAAYLRSARKGPIAYTGLDACAALLDAARERSGADATLVCADLCDGPLEQSLPAGPFDLVCAFGLLHHIPGFARRRELVEQLARRVATGGRLVLAFWRFAERERFAGRRLDWSSASEVDPLQLEPGDHLLAWGDAGDARYCHASDDAEISRLLASVRLRVRDDFEADGREGDLNRYVVLGRSE